MSTDPTITLPALHADPEKADLELWMDTYAANPHMGLTKEKDGDLLWDYACGWTGGYGGKQQDAWSLDNTDGTIAPNADAATWAAYSAWCAETATHTA